MEEYIIESESKGRKGRRGKEMGRKSKGGKGEGGHYSGSNLRAAGHGQAH